MRDTVWTFDFQILENDKTDPEFNDLTLSNENNSSATSVIKPASS
jgi:hypothetical protein